MSENADRLVSIPLEKAIETARLLESIVVSLDRIGSRQAAGNADADTLDQFMTEWLVGPRLSRARSVLWDAITEVIGEEKTEAIAESTPRFPNPVPDEVRALRQELRRRNETQFGHS
ncbi:hypothetical protein ACTOB_004756 [Actinoplanes oblitus]|uniref:Uncharacterized protein n=1 Tax=Actinoplanes oblitus TaxID=3040509 RepID=A0ABY8W4L8_9ACTN|nr:hypothetical protein [Actinoplanes oblitus]WIM92799.1 hypothetical protein ACTOB_004756 [Actinoplanes oblitus]